MKIKAVHQEHIEDVLEYIQEHQEQVEDQEINEDLQTKSIKKQNSIEKFEEKSKIPCLCS